MSEELPEGGRIAIFGGSFDPPHVAHVLAVAYALAAEPVDHVLVVPTFRHPLGKEAVASFDHRMRMISLAVADLRRASVSGIEEQLGGTSLTLVTIEALMERMPAATFRLLIGADILDEMERWHRFDRVQELAPPIVIGRGGYDAPRSDTVTLPEVSSTAIRARLAEASPVTGLVPRAVEAYVAEHGLYRRPR